MWRTRSSSRRDWSAGSGPADISTPAKRPFRVYAVMPGASATLYKVSRNAVIVLIGMVDMLPGVSVRVLRQQTQRLKLADHLRQQGRQFGVNGLGQTGDPE